MNNGTDVDMLADIFTLLLFETKLAKEARMCISLVRKSPRLFLSRYIKDCSVD